MNPARVRYPFSHIPALKDLVLEVENRDGRLVPHVSGPKAWLYRPLFRIYFGGWNRRGVMARTPEGNIYTLYVPPIPSPIHARNLEAHLRTWRHKRRTPLAATIGVTSDCNLRCGHCSAACPRRGGDPLNLDEIGRLIRESLALGVTNITFTGGEPLLRADLEECVARVPRDRAVAQVFTNGWLLDDRRAASLKEAGTQSLQISLDDPEEEENDRGRGQPGTFRAVRRAVSSALRAGLLVGLSTYATGGSVEARRLTRLAALAADWGAHEISVFDVIPTGRLVRRADLMLTASQHRRLLGEAKALRRRYGSRPRIVTQSWTNRGGGLARFIGCLAAHLQFHVTAEGEFTPCDFTPLSFGNVRTASIPELWARMLAHPGYRRHSRRCRMQTPEFRRRYVDTIPEGTPLPYPIAGLE